MGPDQLRPSPAHLLLSARSRLPTCFNHRRLSPSWHLPKQVSKNQSSASPPLGNVSRQPHKKPSSLLPKGPQDLTDHYLPDLQGVPPESPDVWAAERVKRINFIEPYLNGLVVVVSAASNKVVGFVCIIHRCSERNGSVGLHAWSHGAPLTQPAMCGLAIL